MSPGHGDRRRPSLEALRYNLKLLLRRPGTPTLPAGDHLDPSATTTFTIDRRSFLLVVVLFRHYPRPPLCRRDGMSQHQANRVSPPGRLQEKMELLKEKKRALVASVLAAEAGGALTLTEADIEALFATG